MTASVNPSSASVTAKNAAAVVGILLLVIMSVVNAIRFPKAYNTFGGLLANLIEGATPLATAIVTVAVGAFIAALITKVALFLLQFAFGFGDENQDGSGREMIGYPAPFFMKVRKSETQTATPLYYTWKWEHALFLAAALQFLFLAGMGHLARFA